ncbi:hypothetical protein GGX14DRAFT_564386 [Mycena pura]|uniref:F-box domain-containing protein n=1 Tax=Mycena pura TaxID=153505 RepID=A0AAD6VIP3_9AGAR|nr:hypothetical protein GGX14DRAFT_564386 [Mycena pura]
MSDSPFEDILHTNVVPSDAQCDDIRAFLMGPCKELANLTEEIERLQSLLDQTTRKRDELKQCVDAHFALVSPMRRLPDDILREVFVKTLPSTRNTAIISTEGPLLLCRVCKLWRSVALTTPRLWASVHIVVPDRARIHRLIDILRSWLGRSGTVPLAITMLLSQTWTPDCNVAAVFAFLASASRQWKDLEFTLPLNGDDVTALSAVSSEDVPVLQSVKITLKLCQPLSADIGNVVGPPQVHFPFLAAQSLRGFAFHGSYEFLPSPLAVSWGTLRYLTFYENSSSFPWSILGQCTMLERCEIGIGTGNALTRATEPICLPFLSHLSLETCVLNMNSEDVLRIFDDLSLPHLTSLRLHTYQEGDFSGVLPLTHPLRCLDIMSHSMWSEYVVEVLAAMDSLEELILNGEPRLSGNPPVGMWRMPGDDAFLTHLTPPRDGAGPNLCPRLRRIRLLGFQLLSDAVLLQFVRARTLDRSQANNVAPLTHVVCVLDRRMDLDLEQELQDVIAGGLSLSISYTRNFWAPEVAYSPLEGTWNTSENAADFSHRFAT